MAAPTQCMSFCPKYPRKTKPGDTPHHKAAYQQIAGCENEDQCRRGRRRKPHCTDVHPTCEQQHQHSSDATRQRPGVGLAPWQNEDDQQNDVRRQHPRIKRVPFELPGTVRHRRDRHYRCSYQACDDSKNGVGFRHCEMAPNAAGLTIKRSPASGRYFRGSSVQIAVGECSSRVMYTATFWQKASKNEPAD